MDAGGPKGKAKSDINVTPLIDIVLVLLIVFMITAPLLTDAVKLDLPQASSQVNQPDPADITLAITADGVVTAFSAAVSRARKLSHPSCSTISAMVFPASVCSQWSVSTNWR